MERPVRGHGERWLGILLLVLAGLYAGGFVLFAESLPRPPRHLPHADGIVILTGGSARIEAGLDLFERGVGRRLLITGVNPEISRPALKRLVHGGRHFDCCVDLGWYAANTYGNAAETAAWSERHGFRRLIIVTASYHMPRSLNEFSAAMPDVELVPYPVDPDDVDIRDWWFDPAAMHLLGSEYNKYLASLVLTHTIGFGPRRMLDPKLAAIDAARHLGV